jgi:5-formyltetrahydrofolate cyclo-ligase
VTGASASSLEAAARAKEAVRERIWALMEREQVACFPGATGRIPNFAGALAAAACLASLPEWRAARVVKANPDAPQLPIRARAWPRAGSCTWPCLAWPTSIPSPARPERLDIPPRPAASITGSTRAGRRIGVAELTSVDLVICGSVAVNRQGARVGKGGGFADLEFALLVEAGLIGTDTVLVTTVHPLQVLAEALPETTHDLRLDLIVAGDEVLTCRRTQRPPEVLWDTSTPSRSPPSPPWPPGHGGAERFSRDVPVRHVQPVRGRQEVARGSGGAERPSSALHYRPGKPVDMPRFGFLTVGLVGVA